MKRKIARFWQQIRKDFAYWRAATPEERTWFEADRRLREKLTIHDIGIWSHYVGDGSQPLHISLHFNGWGDYANPNGYTNSKKIHAYFEGEFVKRNARRGGGGSRTLSDLQLHDRGGDAGPAAEFAISGRTPVPAREGGRVQARRLTGYCLRR